MSSAAPPPDQPDQNPEGTSDGPPRYPASDPYGVKPTEESSSGQAGQPQYGEYGQPGGTTPQYGQQPDQSQHGQGQYGQQPSQGQYGQGQYGQQPDQGQYGQGQYGQQGAYGQPQYGQGQYGQAQQGQYGQGQYGQPGYGGYGTPPGPGGQPSNGMGLAALIVGIVSLLVAWIPFVGLLAVVGGIVAVVLGIIALGKVNRREATNRTQSIVGIVVGAVAILLAIASTVFGSFIVARVAPEVLGPEFQACVRENPNDPGALERCLDDAGY
jgi:hypothetical protein